MFRAIPGSTIFYPRDAVACERAIELATNTKGITFTRTNRPNTPVIYPNNQNFQIEKTLVVKSSPNNRVLLIGGGVTLIEALTAAEELGKSNIAVRVLDPFTVKPLEREGIITNAKQVDGRILTIEDYYPEGGLGETVPSAIAIDRDVIVKSLATGKVPRSGPPTALSDLYGISAKHIVAAVHELLKL